MIAFSKVDGYSWQDEFRFVFSLTDALKYGKTAQKLTMPIDPHQQLFHQPHPSRVNI